MTSKKQETKTNGGTCKHKRHIRDRHLISQEHAAELEAMFKILANRTRLRMLHAIIREGEICVGDIADDIGMKPQAVSNQLQRLADQGIISSRREGNNIIYSITDSCVVGLMNLGICLMEDSKARIRAGSMAR